MTSESVQIRIKADDQASEVIRKSSDEFAKAQRKADAIYRATLTQLERQQNELSQLTELYDQGAISADKFTTAKARLEKRIESLSEASQDEASAITQVAKASDKAGDSFKDAASKGKASTELFGTLAATLGGSQLGSFTGEVATLTDRMSAFSEVAETGTAGALAFKAGLVAATGVIAFQVGKAIGDVVFETQRWNDELEKARVSFAEIDGYAQSVASRRFNLELQEIDLEGDGRIAAAETLLDRVQKDLTSTNQFIGATEARIQELNDSYKLLFSGFNTGEAVSNLLTRGDELPNLEAQLEAEKQKLATLRDQRDQLLDLTSARSQENAKRQESIALTERALDFQSSLRQELEMLNATKEQQLEIEARRNSTDETFEETLALVKQRDAVLARIEAEQRLQATKQETIEKEKRAQEEAKRSAERNAASLKQIEDRKRQTQKGFLSGLKQQLVLMTQGREAAQAFAFEQQGLSAGIAAQLAGLQESFLGLNVKQAGGGDSGLQAKESRLLSGGGQRVDPVADNTKQLVSQSSAANKLLEQVERALVRLVNKKQLEVQEVGV